MSLPLDQAVTLQSVIDIHEEQYHGDFLKVPHLMGSATTRLLKFEGQPVVGDGLNFKTKRFGGDPARFSRDALGNFPEPQAFTPEEMKLRWNERTAASNDFCKIAASVQVSDYQIANVSNEGQVVDLADELLKDLRENVAFKLAASHRLPRTGLLGQVNAATYSKRQGDKIDYGSCTAYTADHTTMCIVIDNVAPAMIKEGVEYDFYSSGGALQMYRARCVRVNFGDHAEGNGVVAFFERGGSTTDPATADFDDVADNSYIYFSGCKDNLGYTVESWMQRDTSGSTFMGGVDRNTPTFGYLNPTQIRLNTSAVAVTSEQISKTHLLKAAQVMARMFDTEQRVVMMMHDDLIDSLRSRTEEAFWLSVPTTKTGEKRQINLGSMSLAFQHPSLGQVTVEGDQFMTPDHFDVLQDQDWRTVTYQTKAWRFMPGTQGKFYRPQSSSADGSQGMFWRADGYQNVGTMLLRAKAQIRSNALTA
jgi:hypothetical protein